LVAPDLLHVDIFILTQRSARSCDTIVPEDL
jgi:hypothetical protein